MSLSGVFTGVLTLAALEVLVSSPDTKWLGTSATVLEAGVARIISPQLGLVPNLHDSSAPMDARAGSSPAPGPAVPSKAQVNKQVGSSSKKSGTTLPKSTYSLN